MQALDLTIARALAVEVPELVMPEFGDIAFDDISRGNVVTMQPRRRVAMKTWFSVAATVALAVFIGGRFGVERGQQFDSLADEVLAHVTHEPAALQVTEKRVSDDKLRQVVPANIAAMDRSTGLITFAETCPIRGHEVPHLVMQGQHGPITVMLLPNEKISEAITLNDENSHGVILPVGDGSIAIIGSREEKLEDVQKHLLQSVTWET
jgi:hypothetical protein